MNMLVNLRYLVFPGKQDSFPTAQVYLEFMRFPRWLITQWWSLFSIKLSGRRFCAYCTSDGKNVFWHVHLRIFFAEGSPNQFCNGVYLSSQKRLENRSHLAFDLRPLVTNLLRAHNHILGVEWRGKLQYLCPLMVRMWVSFLNINGVRDLIFRGPR